MSKINYFDVIREKHHGAARLIAAGRSISDVAHLLGTSASQLERQCLDPTFRELVSRYRAAETSPNPAARFRAYALAA